ncbi:MAG TPA: transposase [Candidatus Acidoferrum sp.]|nr:transposase [Candidatus Acidoferrum sp.]
MRNLRSSTGTLACAVLWCRVVTRMHSQEWLCYLNYPMTYYERNLPHWLPEGRTIFVTWRLLGSLPQHVVELLRGSDDRSGRQFARAERFLDKADSGPLWLRVPEIADRVEACILRGARELGQYGVVAYVVMPNHVHLLIEPRASLKRITGGIKGVSAYEANRILGRRGKPFWQGESFDHWVRTPGEYEKIRSYIENNPVKAGLSCTPEAWPWSSAAKK